MINIDQFLDQQLAAGIDGDFDTGQQIADQLEEITPNDPRAMFNRGWYELRKGNLAKGHELLDAGRHISVFGNRHIGSSKPIWHGECYASVLLNLEGGLGDQIHGFRFAEILKEEFFCRVTIACSPEIAELFAEDYSVVEHNAACGVYHDYWLPSMSAVVPLGWEYEDIDGGPYIPRAIPSTPGRIGIRWSGNPEFEHQQHRVFPHDLMFDAVKGHDVVSLQRDEGLEFKPDWMPQADVSTWKATRESISECSLVITSCTSVAHLSAAMGVPTWIIIPVLPYYLWALPGDRTPYYNSVKLFRQTRYGSWEEPFKKIKEMLCTHWLKKVA